MRAAGALGWVLLILACGGTTLTAEGQRVRLMKADPAPECEEIGVVDASTSNLESGGNMEEDARNKLRNDAGAKGANYVRLETYDRHHHGMTYTGTAYRCP